jgi:hypothetical protein
MEKSQFDQLLESVVEIEDLKLRDIKIGNNFQLLASARGIRQLELGRWDRFVFTAQVCLDKIIDVF